MFTGIVRERGRGRVALVRGRPPRRRGARDRRRAAIGDSVSVDGVCLTVVGRVGRRASPSTSSRRRSDATSAPPRRSDASTSSRRCARASRSAATRPGPRRRRRPRPSTATRARGCGVDRRRPSCCATCVEKGSIAVDGVSSPSPRSTRTASGRAVPHTLEVTTLGALAPGDAVNLEVDVLAKYVERCSRRNAARRTDEPREHVRPDVPFATDRGGDRGHPPGPVRGRRRRRGPRERGRPHDRGAVRDARGGQLHGHARARPDLPLPHGGALRRARPAADDEHNESPLGTAFTVTIEAREGITTGISAHDRSHTIQVAIDPTRRRRTTSSSPVTSSRSARGAAACSSASARRRRRSTSRGSRACSRPASSARS